MKRNVPETHKCQQQQKNNNLAPFDSAQQILLINFDFRF